MGPMGTVFLTRHSVIVIAPRPRRCGGGRISRRFANSTIRQPPRSYMVRQLSLWIFPVLLHIITKQVYTGWRLEPLIDAMRWYFNFENIWHLLTQKKSGQVFAKRKLAKCYLSVSSSLPCPSMYALSFLVNYPVKKDFRWRIIQPKNKI